MTLAPSRVLTAPWQPLLVGSGRREVTTGAAVAVDHSEETYQFRLRVQAASIGLPQTASHDLRHAYCCWLLLAAGETAVTVAARMGEKDASKVLATYAHIVQVPMTGRRAYRRSVESAADGAFEAPSGLGPAQMQTKIVWHPMGC